MAIRRTTLLCLLGLFLKAETQQKSCTLTKSRSKSEDSSQKYYKQLNSQRVSESATFQDVLFDFNSVDFDGAPAASFKFQVIRTEDSFPHQDDIFIVDENRALRFTSTSEHPDFFDYEKHCEIVVVVKATASSDINDFKLLKLHLELQNENDEPPLLKNKPYPYLAGLPWEAEEDHLVYALYAEDPDTQSSMELSYEIDGSAGLDVRKFFKMEEVLDQLSGIKEGQIKLKTATSFSQPRTFTIPVVIKEENRFDQSLQEEVKVTVGPLEPQFWKEKYEGWIYEIDKTNYPVFDKTGERLKIQVHKFQSAPIAYKLIEESGQPSSMFRIDSNGFILNKHTLDADWTTSKRSPKHHLRVFAEQNLGQKVLSSQVPLIITVKDENDNAPHFPTTQYHKRIPEDYKIGSTVLRVKANDIDTGRNGQVIYAINSSFDKPYFRVETLKDEGAIVVNSPLDFDASPGPKYEFIVVATDNGTVSKSSSVDVIVTTSNVNDESPFIAPVEELVLKDDVPNNFILTQLKATDKDGDNVKFYFTPRKTRMEIFKIVPSSGMITVVSPVPDSVSEFKLDITAVDDGSCCGGLVKQKSSMPFLVKIVDSVNQKPKFESCLNYTNQAHFSEGLDVGDIVLQVKANDTGRGPNGEISYFIEEPRGEDAPFEIDKKTGKIMVRKKVDRENEKPPKEFIQVTVKASDNAKVPQEGWCTFRVEVHDVNDNAPHFNSPSYSEKLSFSTPVWKV